MGAPEPVGSQALSTKQLDSIEHVSWMLWQAAVQLSEHFGLSAVERHLVVHHLHHVSMKTAERVLPEADKTLVDRAKVEVSNRAEETRAENMAADAAGVNTTGGTA
jgi:hypothetical protein